MRTAVFIDGNYLYKNANEVLGRKSKLDMNLVRDGLAGLVPSRSLMRCYYYDALPALSSPPTEEEKLKTNNKQAFFRALASVPYMEPRVGYCRYVQGKVPVQKKVDVLLAVDLVQLSMQQSITDAVIFAGDGDFIPAVEIAKTAGTCIHLVHGSVRSSDLEKIADTKILLTKEMAESWERVLAPVISQKVADAVAAAEKKADALGV